MRQIQSWFLNGMLLVTLASLVSCGGAKTPPNAVAPDAAPQPVAAEKAGGGYAALQTGINKTKAAAEAGNFDQAKAEFTKVEAAWKSLGGPVKAKSANTYNAIADSITAVNTGIKTKNKQTVVNTLQSLSKSMTNAAKL